MGKILCVRTTFPNQSTAKAFCRMCVEDKLVACAQVVSGVESFYLWEGALEETTEYVVILKTSPLLKKKLIAQMFVSHPYECPAVFYHVVESANPDYIQWLEQNLSLNQGNLN